MLPAILLCLLSLPVQEGDAAPPRAQDQAAARAAAERELQVARSGRPQIRPQAARRLVELGPAAVDVILEAGGGDDAGLAELGSEVVEVLGRFGDARLRERLWQALDDRDFPWRPAAARSLAASADPARPEHAAEAERFLTLSRDPLAAVRVAAVQGLEALDLRGAEVRVREMLEDRDERVRRAAAALLDAWGESWALTWLLEDLRRVDEYFGRGLGRSARFAALAVLRERLGDTAGYQPRDEPDTPANREAWQELRRRIVERGGGSELPELPAVARAGPPVEGEVLGLDLRSCRRGEYVLRWCEGDRLVFGVGNPLVLSLPAGTVAGLRDRAATLLESLDRARVFGRPGCDAEAYQVQLGDGRPQVLSVSKGPEAVAGLRPPALQAFARALLDTLPEDHEDAGWSGLRGEVEAALAAVGGALDAPR